MKIFLLSLVIAIVLISCSSKVEVPEKNEEPFSVDYKKENGNEVISIRYLNNGIFKHDSVIYFTYNEYYKDSILLFREKVQLKDGAFETTRTFKNMPGNIELNISRYKEIMTKEVFFIHKADYSEISTEDELLTIFLTNDKELLIKSYEKYMNDERYGLLARVLYLSSLQKIQDNESINSYDFEYFDSLVSDKIQSGKLSSGDYITLLFLKLQGDNNEHVQNFNFQNVQLDDNIDNTLNYIFIRYLMGTIYNGEIQNNFNNISYDTHEFILNDVLKVNNYKLGRTLFDTIDGVIIKNPDKKLKLILDEAINNILDRMANLNCNEIYHQYYYDIHYNLLNHYKENYPNFNQKLYDMIVNLNNCIKTDSWDSNGYTSGYELGYVYSMKLNLINYLIEKDKKNEAEKLIDEFAKSDFEHDSRTFGAINLIHINGVKLDLEKDNFIAAERKIIFLASAKSPQIKQIVSDYNEKAIENGVDTLDIEKLKNPENFLGRKIEPFDIATNNGTIKMQKETKYLFLFFNEDCNACNISIRGIVDGIKEFDSSGNKITSIIVCDRIHLIESEFPDHIISSNPLDVRKALGYHYKSGTILIENGKMTYDSPNIPSRPDFFLEYIFNY